jgi:uncharacterized cupin superfamily protein
MGIDVRVLMPGQPNCLYHRENLEENFLVLFGEFVNEEETPDPKVGYADMGPMEPVRAAASFLGKGTSTRSS